MLFGFCFSCRHVSDLVKKLKQGVLYAELIGLFVFGEASIKCLCLSSDCIHYKTKMCFVIPHILTRSNDVLFLFASYGHPHTRLLQLVMGLLFFFFFFHVGGQGVYRLIKSPIVCSFCSFYLAIRMIQCRLVSEHIFDKRCLFKPCPRVYINHKY